MPDLEQAVAGIGEDNLPELVAAAKIAAAGSEPLDSFIAEVLGKTENQ